MISLKERYDQLVARTALPKKDAWGAKGSAGISNMSSEVADLILSEAIRAKASDVHIEPIQDYIRVRYRMDGKLYPVLEIPLAPNMTLIPRIKVLASMPTDAGSSRKAMDGRFSTSIGTQEYDFRVATFPTIMGEKIAIRILSKAQGIPDLKKLGFSPKDAEHLEQAIQRKSGLLIVSGPTGSGKTTTLYSLLQRLHGPHVNIVTLEDPVEYQINGINQCDIRKKGDDDFSSGLKAILRQDPNIVLIGEIRDKETAEIAIRASMTGHLVLTSLHANSALGTVLRLVNMGLERYMVSYAVTGAVAQRLAPLICTHCRTAHVVGTEMIKRICQAAGVSPDLFLSPSTSPGPGSISYASEQEGPDAITLYKGAGCEHCGGTGYCGRIAIFEVVFFTSALRDAIVREAPMSELEAIASEKGTRTLAADAIQKVRDGLICIDDVFPILLERAE